MERLERHTELLAGLQVIRRQPQRLIHRADRFGAQRRLETDHRRLDAGGGIPARAERLGGGLIEFHIGAPLAVEGPERMPGDRVAVDQEQSGPAARESRGDNEHIGAVAGKHRVLAPGHRPGIPLPGGAGRQFGGTAPARFGVGESQQPLTGGDIVEQCALLV